ncbi:glycosyltransferase family 2 protein [PVC group bacterium]|nr:glycosyltransferase family 2 protein [PVC group bacterium]
MISVIIPVYNEEENIEPLYQELREVLENFRIDYEVLFVNDASTDNTKNILAQLAGDPNNHIRIVHFKKNCGQTSAMDAGFRHASGEIFVTMDGDMQNDPKDIPAMIKHLETHDVICGIRQERRDNVIKRISSKIANGIRNKLSGEAITDTGCTLRVYKKSFVDRLKLFDGMHRFLPTLLKMEGARIYEMPVKHRPRHTGQGKYKFHQRLIKPLLDLFAVCWMKKYSLKYQIEEDRK